MTVAEIEILEHGERVSTREYMRDYKHYNRLVNLNQESLVLTNQGKDEVIISPIPQIANKKYTREDIWNFRFTSDFTNMSDSREIDKVVYGL